MSINNVFDTFLSIKIEPDTKKRLDDLLKVLEKIEEKQKNINSGKPDTEDDSVPVQAFDIKGNPIIVPDTPKIDKESVKLRQKLTEKTVNEKEEFMQLYNERSDAEEYYASSVGIDKDLPSYIEKVYDMPDSEATNIADNLVEEFLEQTKKNFEHNNDINESTKRAVEALKNNKQIDMKIFDDLLIGADIRRIENFLESMDIPLAHELDKFNEIKTTHNQFVPKGLYEDIGLDVARRASGEEDTNTETAIRKMLKAKRDKKFYEDEFIMPYNIDDDLQEEFLGFAKETKGFFDKREEPTRQEKRKPGPVHMEDIIKERRQIREEQERKEIKKKISIEDKKIESSPSIKYNSEDDIKKIKGEVEKLTGKSGQDPESLKIMKTVLAEMKGLKDKVTDLEKINKELSERDDFWVVNIMSWTQSLFTGATEGLFSYLAQDPDAIIAGVPLYNAKIVDVGYSQDDLHLQATGGVFLGFQDGRKSSIRVDATLTGPFQGLMLSMFEAIYYYCRGREVDKEITLKHTKVSVMTDTAIGTNKLVGGISENFYDNTVSRYMNSIVSITGLANPLSPQKYIDTFPQYKEISKDKDSLLEKAIKRNTITIATSTDIMYNMYLHTILHRRRRTYGNNIIEINLFFSRYIANNQVEITIQEENEKIRSEQIYTNTFDIVRFKKQFNIKDDPTVDTLDVFIQKTSMDPKTKALSKVSFNPTSGRTSPVSYAGRYTTETLHPMTTKLTDTSKLTFKGTKYTRETHDKEFIMKATWRTYRYMKAIIFKDKTSIINGTELRKIGALNNIMDFVMEGITSFDGTFTTKLRW